MNTTCLPTTAVRDFREAFYACLDRRAGALFDLADAILVAGQQPPLAHLSLAAPHRRGWDSLYAALQLWWLVRSAVSISQHVRGMRARLASRMRQPATTADMRTSQDRPS